MEKKYPHLFSPIQIGSTVFKNRIIGAPMLGPHIFLDGVPTEKAAAFYGRRAAGGAGVVTLGESCVNRDDAVSKVVTFCLRDIMLKEEYFRRTVYEITRHGAVASIELNHAGNASRSPEQGPEVEASAGYSMGPSAFTRSDGVKVLEMDETMMRRVANDFAVCAANAKALGFGMIQIHGAHGWLLDQFTSPLSNKRTDEYGGSVENRARFPRMVLQAIRDKVGRDFVIEYRVSSDEMVEYGSHVEDVIAFVKQIEDLIDIVHVSVGSILNVRSDNYMFPLWYLPDGINVERAAQIKAQVKCKVSVVGSIRNPEMAEAIIRDGKADFVAMNRSLLADPDWCNKALEGRENEIRPCVRCITCHDMLGGDGCVCAVNPESGPETQWVRQIPSAGVSRKVVVIGGGFGGMQAALTAAKCGHQVVLFEKSDALGGIMKFTDHSPVKKDLCRLKNYFIGELNRSGVDIRLSTEATPALVEAEQPHTVLCAVGSTPFIPNIPGMASDYVLDILQAYDCIETLQGKTVVIGGNLSGVEFAIDVAHLGGQVTVVEMADRMYASAPHFYAAGIEEELENHANRMTLLTNTACTEVRENGISVCQKDGSEIFLEADHIVCAVGMRANADAAESFRETALYFRRIGDCSKVGKVKHAIEDGFRAAMSIDG